MTDHLDGLKPLGVDPALLRSTPRRNIEELLVGEQISELIYFDDRNKFGGRQAGFKLRDGSRVVVMAAPGAYLAWARATPAQRARRDYPDWPYRWGLALGLWEPLAIVTPRMERELVSGRDAIVGAAQADVVQERVEGQIILGAPLRPEPTADVGERIKFELTGNLDLWFQAVPGAGVAADGKPVTAGLDILVEDTVGRQVFVMGSGRRSR